MRERNRDGSRIMKIKRSWLISLAVAAACIVVIFSAFMALRGRDTMTIDEPVHTYVNGARMEWNDGVMLIHKDDMTTLKASGSKSNWEIYPLISEDDTTITLQKSCSWNRISDEAIYRLDYFTTISKDEQGIVLKRRGKENRDISGFVYDNSNTYIFLEPVTLTWGEEIMDVEPMTIVQVSYRSDIHIFGPGVEPRFENISTDEVMAEFSDGKKVNLAVDRYYMVNGSWRLLFLPLELLPDMD